MNSVNSRNMFFMILFVIVLCMLFIYVTFSGDFSAIYANMS